MQTVTLRQLSFFLVPAALLLLVRYLLPADIGETAHIHNAIADSILNGNKWGLVALLQYPDAPLLPTLALVLSKCLAAPLNLNPHALLAATAQIGAVFIIVRQLDFRRRLTLFAAAGLLVLPVIPLFRHAMACNDPNWLSAMPLLLALVQLDRFAHQPQLKHLIAIAGYAALLVFCGPLMMLAAIVLIVVTSTRLQPLRQQGDGHGLKVILWLPLLYALLLWLPWYGSGEQNVFRTLTEAAAHPQQPWHLPLPLHAPAAAAVAAFILALRAPFPLAARAILPLLLASPFVAAFFGTAGLAPVGLAPLLVSCVAFLAVTCVNQGSSDAPLTSRQQTSLVAASLALTTALVMGIRHDRFSRLQKDVPTAIQRQTAITMPRLDDLCDFRDLPDRQQLIASAQRHWPGARVALCGQRLTQAAYPDPQQRHFYHLPDNQPLLSLRKRAVTEQLFLLVPPPDTRFYAPDSPFRDIHEQGTPYLFLVEQFPHGWQLWRTLPPPKP